MNTQRKPITEETLAANPEFVEKVKKAGAAPSERVSKDEFFKWLDQR